MSPQILLLVVAMGALFYFMILRPQKRAKAAKAALMSSLQPGSEILTVGGIFGTVVEVREGDLDLEVADGVIMRIALGAISTVIPDTDEDDEDDDGDELADDVDHDDDGEPTVTTSDSGSTDGTDRPA